MNRAVAFLLAVGIGAGVSWATDVADVKADVRPDVKTHVDEVALDVVVRDKHGKPVRDLRPEEFAIVDDGRPVKLNKVHFVSGTDKAEMADTAAPLSTAKIGVMSGGKILEARLVSLVFDSLDLSSGKRAREGALELLKTVENPNVFFSVWRIGRRIQLVDTFTPDRNRVRKAIEAATAGGVGAGGGSNVVEDRLGKIAGSAEGANALGRGDVSGLPAEEQGLARLAIRAMDGYERMDREQRSRPSMSGLTVLIKQQSVLPGRKTVVYFSTGLPLTPTLKEHFKSIINEANNAGVSIYSVDASALTPMGDMEASRVARGSNPADLLMSGVSRGATGIGPAAANPNAGQPGAPATSGSVQQRDIDTRSFDEVLDSVNRDKSGGLRQLAQSTGGFYVAQASDLRTSLRRIGEDLAAYYQVFYTPDRGEYDGHFRPISVSVSRSNAVVQARKGYFAIPPNFGSEMAPFEAPLLKVLTTNPRPEDLTFNSGVLRFGQRQGKTDAVLVVELPLAQFEHPEDATANVIKTHFTILALVQDKDAQLVEKLSQNVAFQVALERRDQMRNDTFTFQRPFAVLPGDYTIELAVSDEFGKKAGAKSIPFTVPATPPGLGISDMVFVRGVEPLDPNRQNEEPAQYQGGHVVVGLPRTFKQTDPERSVFFTLYPDAQIKEKPSVELELRCNQQRVGHGPLPIANAEPGKPIRLASSIQPSVLDPGDYTMVARVKQGTTVKEQTLQFHVDGQPIVRATPKATPGVSEDDGPEADVAKMFVSGAKLMANSLKPSDAEIQRMIDAARKRAVDYRKELPSFICTQVTTRYVDQKGKGAWKQKDRFTELMQFVEGNERTEMVEKDGVRVDKQVNLQGARMFGEFGGLFYLIFSDDVNAKMEWEGVGELKGSRVDIFRYEVPQERSRYRLHATWGRESMLAPYKGQFFVDSNTLAVKRITVEAQKLPKNYVIQQSIVTVDYDYVPIAGQDYLLPQSASLYMREGKHFLVRNEKEFRQYLKFGGDTSVKYQTEEQ